MALAIFDCRDDSRHEFNNETDFKRKLVELTKNGAIEKFSIFASKLKAIPFKDFMHMPMPEGRRLRHEYCEVEVKDAHDQTLFVSLEKGPEGILAQISPEKDIVCRYRHEKGKKDPTPRKLASRLRELEMTDIKTVTTRHVATIDEFLAIGGIDGKFTISPHYNLVLANCQLFVNRAEKRLDYVGNAKAVKFCLPGSGNRRVFIDDPSIPEHLENMYPSLQTNGVVQIPELEEQFIAFTGTTHPQNTNAGEAEKISQETQLESLKFKQKSYLCVLECLRNVKTSSGEEGWRVIFSNLTQTRVIEALDHGQMPDENFKRIVTFWQQAFDILAISRETGCIIVQFEQKDVPAEKRMKEFEEKRSMLTELGDIDPNAIHLIQIEQPNDGAMEETFDVIRTRFQEILHDISISIDIKNLATRLVLLNRLENHNVLLHDKFEKQIWGNAALFTEEQHKVIDDCRWAFENSESIHLQVHGPYGAGKTLVLFEIARNFVENVRDVEKKVFIHVRYLHEILVSQLRRRVTEEGMENRVTIGDAKRTPDILALQSLILVDEYWEEFELLEKVRKEQSLVMFSSIDQIVGTDKLQVSDSLKRHNLTYSLRATKKLIDFTTSSPPNYTMSMIPGISIDGSDPEIIKVEKPWGKDEKFLTKIVDKLKDLHKKFSSVCSQEGSVLLAIYGHPGLKEKIERKLEGIRKSFTVVQRYLESLGAQWPAVVVVIDGSLYADELGSTFPQYISRASTSLTVLYHDTEDNMRIDEHKSLERIFTNEEEVVKRINEVAARNPDLAQRRRIFVIVSSYDGHPFSEEQKGKLNSSLDFKLLKDLGDLGEEKGLLINVRSIAFDSQSIQLLKKHHKLPIIEVCTHKRSDRKLLSFLDQYNMLVSFERAC